VAALNHPNICQLYDLGTLAEGGSFLVMEFVDGSPIAPVGSPRKLLDLAVQIATRAGAMSGGQTALTISIQKVEDGIMIELGRQAWLGVAASIGHTAISALRNPFSLLGRLDDIAQDFENMQLSENVWKVISSTVATLGASARC